MCQCKICKSEIIEEVYVDRFDNTYHMCEVCEFVFLDESEIVSIDKEKEVYDQHDNSFESEGYVKMFENFINVAVSPFVKEKKEALEFGCGPGPVLAKMLENRGWNVTKYDPIYYNNEYKDKKYDLITSTEVFEHFKNPLKEFEKLSNLLKKGGILSIMTLMRPKTKKEFIDWWYIRDKTHIAFYSPKTLYLLGKKFGLKMIYNNNERLITYKKV
ncbi:MAG: class I SAM-dependent methyltransferase [Bacillota bacterium]